MPVFVTRYRFRCYFAFDRFQGPRASGVITFFHHVILNYDYGYISILNYDILVFNGIKSIIKYDT